MTSWQPDSWQTKPSQQQPHYPSQPALDTAVDALSHLPPLVTSPEVDNLKEQIAEAASGQRFILQGGDCAESFDDCRSTIITNKIKILLQMSLVMLHGMRIPITRVGRIAGQYAKPRSSDTETRDNVSLPSYRGDIVNSPEFTEAARTPNPKLLLKGYSHSAMTLNFIRALVDGGFADLQQPETWNLDFVKHSPQAQEYQALAQSIADSLEFIKTIRGIKSSSLNRVEIFTSHEALHLHYEQALARQNEQGQWYALSTHFPWIGMRTGAIDEGHIEFLRGINNPIGVKVGPSTSSDWLCDLVNTLNPDNEPGRLTLISRLGQAKVAELLPPMIAAVKKTGKTVMWSCDPMHGNTQSTNEGYKTRSFDNILSELQQTYKLHHQENSFLGGVHFELTGENVTECIGGARGLNEADLKRAYKSAVDPRLNYEQALEMAMLIVQMTKR